MQTFLSFGSNEYYMERNSLVLSFSEAEEKCNASQVTLAVINTKNERFCNNKIGIYLISGEMKQIICTSSLILVQHS